MNRFLVPLLRRAARRAVTALFAGVVSVFCGSAAFAAPVTTLASYPLFLAPPTTPNIFVMLDNSGSMDATMAGKVVSGDIADTRANIARSVLTNIITANRSSFNWGLGTFELSGAPALYNTQAYFVGSDATMVYTNSCSVPVGSVADTTGYSADGPQLVVSAAGVRPVAYKNNCIQNPDLDAAGQPRNGLRYLTFEVSGDDPSVNDVYYTGSTDAYAFGIGVTGVAGKPNRYNIYRARDASSAWTPVNFDAANCVLCPIDFTPTDAGWLPYAATQPRMLFVRRGWGYGNYITGRGRLVEPVVSAATTTPALAAAEANHYGTLMTVLGTETIDPNSGEIKNAAFSTPLVGSMTTVHDYFAGNLGASLKSPVSQTCQKNYVVLATDGNPTGKLDGTQYSPSQWINAQDANGNWVFGQAQLDVFDQIGTFDSAGVPTGGLRATTLSGASLSNNALARSSFDIQTYVIGLGDTLANPSSIAALNQMAKLGGGYPTAFLGTSVGAVQAAFESIVASIQGRQGGSSSVALNSATLSTSSLVYQAVFNSTDWTGDLKALSIGSSGALSATPVWSAATRIAAQDWNTGRNILTTKPSAAAGARGIAFRWPVDPAAPTTRELDVAQVAALSTDSSGTPDNQGQLRLNFLRGDKSREVAQCPGCAPNFRNRSTPLGDLINSAPVLVGAPSATYYDDIEAVAYSSFVAARRGRTPVVYLGANDGMLHAISAGSGNGNGGTELMAYVPSPLLPSMNLLTAPGYQHRYYVDATPTVGDVFYAGNWKSLLVSGMRSGARGLFALDVTDPSTFSEGNAGSLVRWEFLNARDADMGYLFSQPVLAKLNNGRWAVIVGNGYNSGSTSGHAVLFVLDAEDGSVIAKLDTGAGTSASPNGLSGPAVIDSNDDGIADIAYAGDLNGNLWKFDLSAAVAAQWRVGNGGLPLFNTDPVSPPGTPTYSRAISDRPNVTAFPNGGYMVVFGTGSYLSASDLSSSQPQALYGIVDNLIDGPTVTASALVQQTVTGTATGVDGALYRVTTHAVGAAVDSPVNGDNALSLANYYSSRRGWYLDLPTPGERSITDPRIRGGRGIFTSLIPSSADPCSYGGSGWLIELDVVTGNRDDRGTFDTNNSGGIDAGDTVAVSGTGQNVASGRLIGQGIPATPGSLVSNPSNPPNTPPTSAGTCTEIQYVAKSDGSTEVVRVLCGNASSGRAMWREVR